MKLAVTSDLHGYLPEIKESDVLLICGDIIPLNLQSSVLHSREWFATTFINWCNNQPVKRVLFIPGNHDLYFERDVNSDELFLDTKIKNIHMRQEEIEGIKFYGCAWCKAFGLWSFMKHSKELIKEYEKIPEGLDVLITHDAPSIGKVGWINTPWAGEADASNPWLADAVLKKKPKYLFCGHLHSGDHELKEIDGINIANVSYVDESYNPTNSVLYHEI